MVPHVCDVRLTERVEMWRLQDGMAGRRQTIRSPLIAGYEEQVELLAGGRHSRAAALYSTHNFGSGGRTTWVTASVAASPAHRRPVRAGDRPAGRAPPVRLGIAGGWPGVVVPRPVRDEQ